ncbi:Wiskott-Aldrich syndrome protein family member 3 [Corvus brachyrhynchos]|uniref:Wiskott-Aldrich syndrome protein family member n=1 Tax=Corvus brachyrhynchos TaxID=85066 RepID=A0A091EVX5_CORBR|nr:Wiskott-Aldrich syndrome protein family member 3 [Corvus brachyrhynchos]
MPLVKRNIEPRHLCRGALPDGVTSELECVTNSTLAAIIKQLGSLSRHAEDIFGELFNEANSFYMRMNSLQERVDLLVIKVTQLDSTVEEVSLQDINMRKAFKSSTVQNQQVVSRNSIPNPVMEMYQRCDKPPPLNILTPYRDDKKDGLKFYTDPSYFFNLWKEKMLQATEDKRKEKRRQKEQRLVEDSTREVKKVRKARNRRLEWNMMAYDKEFRPDNRFSPSPYHMASSEGSLSPDNSYASDAADHSYPASPNHPAQLLAPASHLAPAEHKEGVLAATNPPEHVFRPAAGSRQNSLTRLQQPHVPPPPEAVLNGPRPHLVKDYGFYGPKLPVRLKAKSVRTAFGVTSSPIRDGVDGGFFPGLLPALPHSMPHSPSHQQSPTTILTLGQSFLWGSEQTKPERSQLGAGMGGGAGMSKRVPSFMMPMSDARSDLLAAIRRGIQLRKVQEQWEQEAKKEPVGNDVATILSRRIAVEYSESDDDSELDDNEWSD